MWKDFKEFITKGSVMNLAVGFVLGAAFTAIVTSLVNDIIMPLIGIITGGIDFSHLFLTFGSAKVAYGAFISAIINYILISLAVFLIVRALSKFSKKEEATARTCPYCLQEVDDAATRCPHCTSMLEI